MRDMQESLHSEGHDYAAGSPHIKHYALRRRVVEALQDMAGEILDQRGSCRVLEVGAGHGTFTDHLVAVGATVDVTEMSEPSAVELRRRFSNNPAVRVISDPDGTAGAIGEPVDLVVCLSVLHHIPDYVAAVTSMLERVAPGGAFISFQDPLWYPRRTGRSRIVERVAYLSWRVSRGNFLRGIATSIRRVRGVLDESNPSDMVEYHVVRDGVDEIALEDLMRSRFEKVHILRYWSTQSGLAQAIGSQLFAPNTFGLVAQNRIEQAPDGSRLSRGGPNTST